MFDTEPPAASALPRLLLKAGLWTATGRTFEELTARAPHFEPEKVRDALVSLAIREKMIPMLDAFLKHQRVDLGPRPSRLTAVFEQVSSLHYRELASVVRLLSAQGIGIALLKGGDLDLSVYGANLPRSMSDLDFLARPVDVPAVEAALAASGFHQGIFDRENLSIRAVPEDVKQEVEAGKAELVEFGKIVLLPGLSPLREEIGLQFGPASHHRMVVLDRDVYVYVALDVHVNLAEGFSLEDVWRDMREISLPDGDKVFAQSFTDMVWFLAVRLYHETLLDSRATLRAFVDIIAVLHRFAGHIHWGRLLEMGNKYKLQPSLFFVLWHVNELLGPVVPDWLLKDLDPRGTTSDRSHDWGDFIPKMLGELTIHPLKP